MRERDCARPCETSGQRAADFPAWMRMLTDTGRTPL